jgi:hypothetical protein
MACPITKEISRFGSFKTCISWAFFALEPIDHGLKPPKHQNLWSLRSKRFYVKAMAFYYPLWWMTLLLNIYSLGCPWTCPCCGIFIE